MNGRIAKAARRAARALGAEPRDVRYLGTTEVVGAIRWIRLPPMNLYTVSGAVNWFQIYRPLPIMTNPECGRRLYQRIKHNYLRVKRGAAA